MNMTAEPLIYTSKGNVPIASLEYRHEWRDEPDALTFIEEYRDATGELVKRAVHVLSKRGAASDTATVGID